MSGTGREIAKFFAGFAANETIGHWWIGIWGSSLLPLKIGGITFTSTFNLVCMVFWPIALALLVYVGWFRKPHVRDHAAPPVHGAAA
jgi:hypothetical protein